MRYIIVLLLLILTLNSFAQDKITVLINGSETFIEKSEKSTFKRNGENVLLVKAYRLGSSSSSKLKEGIKTAIRWIDLNKTHKKSFEKEVCRFKAMKKELYKTFGYVDHISDEMTLMFKGKSDGSFELLIKQSNYPNQNFISFTDKEMVEKFKDLLDGKSVNKEIDDIFKH